ncbi:hypothetical protein C1645_736760 [Glomus cerebriforme]|uniref:HAT C-terminal dimerisation domain-containing protein n=1 Tax=Glomus cerebriforme TaxID=658196 RepID=A0A397T0C5_9GLOM|nr:hypothetical protein C1645_736760 [Glomus cerebriforme]
MGRYKVASIMCHKVPLENRYAEFADQIYLLCFFLHPSYTSICWAQGTFRDLLLIVNEVFMKIEKKIVNDSFPQNKDYLVQLALKLFSVTPHVAGCERVWSSLGWIYAYYHANAKKELSYYSVEKSEEEIYQIFIDAHLNLNQGLLKLENDLFDYNNNEEKIVIGEEKELDIDRILNLDVFINTLDVIEDSIDNVEKENNEPNQPIDENENNNDIDWDPAAEADRIVDTIY